MGTFIVNMTNKFIEGLAESIIWVMSFFPESPFQSPAAPPASVNLGWITWIFDFPTWIQHFSLILAALGVYYVVRVVARWLKVVRN